MFKKICFIRFSLFVIFVVCSFFLLPFISGDVFFHGSRANSFVALSFDDGPSVYTSQIVDVLYEYNVSASFFVVGNKVSGFESVLLKAKNNGNEIGLHSFNHNKTFLLLEKGFEEDLDNSLERVSFLNVSFFRPPYGVLTPFMKTVCDENNLTVVLWDLMSFDYLTKNPFVLANYVIANTDSGSVIVLHDGVLNSNVTLAALPLIIEGLQNNGFTIVSLSSLLN